VRVLGDELLGLAAQDEGRFDTAVEGVVVVVIVTLVHFSVLSSIPVCLNYFIYKYALLSFIGFGRGYVDSFEFEFYA
jgi:hypothetical protein